jgi:hypothetical protein
MTDEHCRESAAGRVAIGEAQLRDAIDDDNVIIDRPHRLDVEGNRCLLMRCEESIEDMLDGVAACSAAASIEIKIFSFQSPVCSERDRIMTVEGSKVISKRSSDRSGHGGQSIGCGRKSAWGSGMIGEGQFRGDGNNAR